MLNEDEEHREYCERRNQELLDKFQGGTKLYEFICMLEFKMKDFTRKIKLDRHEWQELQEIEELILEARSTK